MILYYRRTSCLLSDVLPIIITTSNPVAILEVTLDSLYAFRRPFSGAVLIKRRHLNVRKTKSRIIACVADGADS